jgi:tRNA (guanine10-N2)-dimethyltransferase
VHYPGGIAVSLVPYFFELSGEHPTLPEAEAYGCVAAECEGFSAAPSGPGYAIFGFEPNFLSAIASRLALTHRLGRYLGSCSPEGVETLAADLNLPPGTVAVRGKRYQQYHLDTDVGKLTTRVGAIVTKGRKVDLERPEVELRIFVSDRVHFFLGEREIDRTQFERRKVAERPFFSPISLHPKFARALVNKTFVPRGGRLLDPFCGTGGVLIEAATIGVKVIGSDISPAMIKGCRKNMEHFDLPYEALEVSDIGDIASTVGPVNVVATDPPYGRATSTNKEPLGDLYARSLMAIASVLEKGSRAGVVLPVECPEVLEGLELVHHHSQKVHRSLSRNYCIFRRLPPSE